MKKILKKITICITCIGLAFVSSIPKSLAFGTSSNQAITHYNEIPINYFLLNANNKLYSSSSNNSIYWLIDKTTLQNRVYTFYADNLSNYIIDLNVVSEEDFNRAFNNDFSNDNFITNFYDNYYLVDIKHLSDLYLYPSWSDNIACTVVYKPIPTIFSLNGVVHTFNYGVSNKNTIQLLQTNFDNLQLSLQNSDLRDRLIPLYNEGYAFGRQEGVAFGYDLALSELSDSEFYESILAEGKRQGIVEGFNEGFVEGILTAFEGGFEGFGETELRGLKDNISYSYWLGVSADSGEMYQDGYQDGFKVGQNNPTSISWALALFSAMGLFLSVPLLGPNITIGVIVGVPLILSLIFFVLKLIRG